MSEHDHKSGGNTVAIVVAICLVLLLIVPCGLVVLGGASFVFIRSSPPQQVIIEDAAPIETTIDSMTVEPETKALQVDPEGGPPPDEEAPRS
jgi:hypothetical protein